MSKIFLSLGSSLGNREQYLKNALCLIENQIGKIKKKSNIYETQPWGFLDENLFLNQIIEIETNLQPTDLLDKINKIEEKLNRIRNSNNYQARTIDIDILFYDDEIIRTQNLQIPHKHLHNRNFILKPFSEIAPDFIHPEINITIKELSENCIDKLEVTLFS